MAVGDEALRCSADVVLFGFVLFEKGLSEGGNHLAVAAGFVVVELLALVGRRGADFALDVKVKAIDARGAEWPRLPCFDPGGGLRAKGTPKESRKVLGGGVADEILIDGVPAAERQQYLLAVGLLTGLDIWANVLAIF